MWGSRAAIRPRQERTSSSHDSDRSEALSTFSKMFEAVSVDATAYLMSAWRGEVNLLELNRPEYKPFSSTSRRTPSIQPGVSPVVEQAIEALARIGSKAG